jgi:aldose 1-epimerase
VENPANGRGLDVYSTQPGLQVYDGQMILPPGPHKGFAPWAGLCLETQALPDSPNHPAFPDAILRPGQTYRHRTEYRFR